MSLPAKASKMAAGLGADDDNPLVVQQFVQDVLDLSSQYGSDASISYTAFNLVGKPSVYPNYGDYADAFLLRTYGPWWETSSTAPKALKTNGREQFFSQDFVDLKFEHKVYPLCIDIYETYNPGAIVKILAFDSDRGRWQVLWQGQPSKPKLCEARIFSPPIKSCKFSSNIIRLEFCHRHLEYYTELDAILFFGSLVPPCPSINLLNVCEKLRNLTISVPLHPEIRECPTIGDGCCDVDKTADRKNWFEHLPTEVIQLIVSYLDLPSLCQASSVSRSFHKHCSDPLLYTEVNLQTCWEKVSKQTLSGLRNRCKNLHKLNLSWCGHYDRINPTTFTEFLECCGYQLTCLRLGNCQFVNNSSLQLITDVCTNLEELDLRCCRQNWLDEAGFQELSRLTKLRRLNLYRTLVDLESMILIIRCCRYLEHVNLGACIAISNFDEVALELGRCSRNLKSIDMWRAKTLTAVGITGLAQNCPSLEEVDFGWCMEVSTTSGCLIELTHGCPKLKKLGLAAIRTVSDMDLMAISINCLLLEQLDILGTREASPGAVQRALTSCKRLKLLDVSFCAQISEVTVDYWKHLFPTVAIKKSSQTSFSSAMQPY